MRICDRCGGDPAWSLELHYVYEESKVRGYAVTGDLCSECISAMKEWMGTKVREIEGAS